MTYIVDRIEGESLVLENENGFFVTVPKELLPQAKAGDCIDIFINKEKTKDRQKNVGRLMDKLFVD